MRKSSSRERIYQLKITLKRSKPPIWRRVQTPADTTLATVHGIIQVAMNWYNCHLHEFHVGRKLIGDPEQLCGWDMGPEPDVIDEAEVTLADLGLREGRQFAYVYDFGDDWEHEVKLEKVLEPDPDVCYPICIKAVRAAPPEDAGGMRGYYAILEALADPEHPEHETYFEWLGGGKWDPESVDLGQINKRLKNVRRWVRSP